MVDDPYKVLGIAQGATQEEIKRAYRRKAKENHPDLHPNDPGAERRMNEINEAYDMLMNPDKYAQRRAQEQARQQYSQPYGNPYGSQRSASQDYGSYGSYSGTGWNSDFGFGFEDLFGFGRTYGGSVPPPTAQPGDSQQVRQVIQEISQRQYQAAVARLETIPSTGRNARWYYLSGVANHGAGNTIAATERMQRAVQMDPDNQTYRALLQQFRSAGQTYEDNARGYNMGAMDPMRMCMTFLCLTQVCPFCGYGLCCC